ncbi:hypothetical protein SAMN05216184_105196 [Georgenia satyanarayanai]|uniref:Uncharacterized protein n=1 Tax=Georgenia satyanarayanai TaxID=860221 RepID=A0A2Y9AD90_9MICO|nr:hypothetical protein [Georgenia satyanarayanai]PYF99952.1 hypothetical protein A8987_105196 [Georgenia satyanarayanai]SSA41956.1 hypothetical protein SAMN05216184_105196 [Georgenia satyanarayanai]
MFAASALPVGARFTIRGREWVLAQLRDEQTLDGDVRDVRMVESYLIEHFTKEELRGENAGRSFAEMINNFLRDNLPAWTIIEGRVGELHPSSDVDAVHAALDATEGRPGARHHLQRILF